ncbi:MAG: class I SAM-dependent rRNA methyltransferase [Flavobacteriales bacterium]|nr:class I SAM-dependent rRNA methyltransferase [Flavobacteriales bacterium]
MRHRTIIRDPRDRVRNGHPWIFDNQVVRVEGDPKPGDVVQVFDDRRRPIGQGYFNPASKIQVRILTADLDEPIDDAFFLRKVREAWAFRRRMVDTTSCRVIFGESDGLPACVADKFEDTIVLQTLSLGMDRWKHSLVEALREVTGVTRFYERNDVPIREKEGLRPIRGFLGDTFTTRFPIMENGLKVIVDVAEGQKTGHFLDQRVNHAAIAPVVEGADVLDCFTHTGGFALHAAHYGAKRVEGLDISPSAIRAAVDNAELNGLTDRCSFREANVFDHLAEAGRSGRTWDVVVLDPPAFAKSRATVAGATRGYKEINLRAMKCLPRGGFLVTCSCSQHMTPDLFRAMVADAAKDARRHLREVHYGTQPPDHPVHWSIPESLYLKCLILQVL